MTTRERGLVILLGAVVLGGLAFNFGYMMLASPGDNSSPNSQFNDAYRLLRSSRNITARNQASVKRLTDLQKRFFSTADLEGSKVSLLKEVENIAAAVNMDVRQKNMIRFNDDLIGVALEGKTSPESLIRFIQKTTESKIGLKIQRMQMHSLAENRQLSYQMTVSSLMVKHDDK